MLSVIRVRFRVRCGPVADLILGVHCDMGSSIHDNDILSYFRVIWENALDSLCIPVFGEDTALLNSDVNSFVTIEINIRLGSIYPSMTIISNMRGLLKRMKRSPRTFENYTTSLLGDLRHCVHWWAWLKRASSTNRRICEVCTNGNAIAMNETVRITSAAVESCSKRERCSPCHPVSVAVAVVASSTVKPTKAVICR